MKYQALVSNPLEENTYLVWDEKSGEAAIIDAGMWCDEEYRQVESFIAAHHLTLKYALLTHAHFDHIYGLSFIRHRYDILPMCHADDVGTYQSQPDMMREFGIELQEPLPPFARLLADGDVITLGEDLSLSVIHTPGHTPGGCCFYDKEDGVLFSGDTLFRASVGRTDLPGGNPVAEFQSIRQRILTLPPDTQILPGHGPHSTIAWEQQNNPYV